MERTTGEREDRKFERMTTSRNLQRGSMGVTQRTLTKPERQDRALLVRTDRSNVGQVLTLAPQITTLGRHPDNVACVEDEGISRFHAKIVQESGRYVLEDLGSSNGTHLNGCAISQAELKNGDCVQLGAHVSFRFSLASGAEELALRRLYEASVRDPLTQAFNRRHFDTQAQTEISFAVRHGGALSLLVVDIDFFKAVNDHYGHPAGDEVLKTVTSMLRRQLRAGDMLARYGGEEFVVLLRGTGSDHAALVGDRLRKAVERSTTQHAGHRIRVTVSIGCGAIGDCRQPSLDELFRIADQRLYQAKSNGRNRVVAS